MKNKVLDIIGIVIVELILAGGVIWLWLLNPHYDLGFNPIAYMLQSLLIAIGIIFAFGKWLSKKAKSHGVTYISVAILLLTLGAMLSILWPTI